MKDVLRIALRGQVEDEVGLRSLDRSLDRHIVAKVAVHQSDPISAIDAIQVLFDVVERAAPPREAN